MDIQVSQAESRVPVAILKITGELNADTAGQLDAEARKTIDAGTHNLLLDLSGVPYISSYGIRTLSEIFNWLRQGTPGEDDAALDKGLRDGTFKSGHLKLLNPTPQVRRVLSLAGVDMFLETFDNLDAALASF
jgi:anti-anti-sigma regulatory factor